MGLAFFFRGSGFKTTSLLPDGVGLVDFVPVLPLGGGLGEELY